MSTSPHRSSFSLNKIVANLSSSELTERFARLFFLGKNHEIGIMIKRNGGISRSHREDRRRDIVFGYKPKTSITMSIRITRVISLSVYKRYFANGILSFFTFSNPAGCLAARQEIYENHLSVSMYACTSVYVSNVRTSTDFTNRVLV